MSDDRHVHDWTPIDTNFGELEEAEWFICEHCPAILSREEVIARLNKIDRLDTVLVMDDDEMHAYEWAIKQLFRSVAADYARTLAKYIKRVKLAYTGRDSG